MSIQRFIHLVRKDSPEAIEAIAAHPLLTHYILTEKMQDLIEAAFSLVSEEEMETYLIGKQHISRPQESLNDLFFPDELTPPPSPFAAQLQGLKAKSLDIPLDPKTGKPKRKPGRPKKQRPDPLEEEEVEEAPLSELERLPEEAQILLDPDLVLVFERGGA